MKNKFILIGSLLAFIGVAAGAFGAHGLKTRLTEDLLQIYDTAVRYQMYHAFAILFVAMLFSDRPIRILKISGWMFFAGILLFSGSLYLLSLTGVRWFGAITPFGGLAFLGGWLCLLIYGAQAEKSKKATS